MTELKTMFLLLALQSVAFADPIIMVLGDSVAAEHGSRRILQIELDKAGVASTFVGDVKYTFPGDPPNQPIDYQAFGGATFHDMLEGRTVERGQGSQFEAGVRDALNRYTPNMFIILGGYNNLIGEQVGAGLVGTKPDYGELVDFIVTNMPTANIFVNNVTDFDPAKTWGSKRPNVLDWNDYLAVDVNQRNTAGQNVYLVDNFSDVTYGDLYPDGLHVLYSGRAKIGKNWAHALATVQSRVLPGLC